MVEKKLCVLVAILSLTLLAGCSTTSTRLPASDGEGLLPENLTKLREAKQSEGAEVLAALAHQLGWKIDSLENFDRVKNGVPARGDRDEIEIARQEFLDTNESVIEAYREMLAAPEGFQKLELCRGTMDRVARTALEVRQLIKSRETTDRELRIFLAQAFHRGLSMELRLEKRSNPEGSEFRCIPEERARWIATQSDIAADALQRLETEQFGIAGLSNVQDRSVKMADEFHRKSRFWRAWGLHVGRLTLEGAAYLTGVEVLVWAWRGVAAIPRIASAVNGGSRLARIAASPRTLQMILGGVSGGYMGAQFMKSRGESEAQQQLFAQAEQQGEALSKLIHAYPELEPDQKVELAWLREDTLKADLFSRRKFHRSVCGERCEPAVRVGALDKLKRNLREVQFVLSEN